MKYLRTKDIKALRERWRKIQENKDVITGLPIEKPVLDHNHKTGLCRGVLDFSTNQFLGKTETAFKRFMYKEAPSNLPFILRAMADYLETVLTEKIIHPKYISILIKRHSRMDIKSQVIYLQQLGVPQEEISKLKTKKELNKRYKMELCKKENQYQV